MKLTDLLESKTLAGLATDDYQRRNGHYPKSGVPVDIEGLTSEDYDGAAFSFKNTSESEAKSWVERFLKQKGLAFDKIDVGQDGDYEDDWVHVTVNSKKK